MTDFSDFDDDALDLILETPRAVMEGAIVADGEVKPIAFLKEVTAGAKVFREGQRHENPFVKAVAGKIRDRQSSPSENPGMPDPEVAVTKALKLAEESTAVLRARGDLEEADAYGAWLVRIATKIAEAARTREGGFFSKKVAVTEAEQDFIDQLTALVGR